MRECAYQYSFDDGCKYSKADHDIPGFSHHFCPFKIDPRVDELILNLGRMNEIDSFRSGQIEAIKSCLSGVGEDVQDHEDRLAALEEKIDTYRYKYTFVSKEIFEHAVDDRATIWTECKCGGWGSAASLAHRTIEVKS